jgi:integrase
MTTAPRSNVLVVVGKRAYGTGTLYEKEGAWWGRWRTANGRRPHRKVGPARTSGRDGLTKKQAEQALREMILASNAGARSRGSLDPTVGAMGAALVAKLRGHGRKRSTIESVEGHLRVHITPLLGELPVSSVEDGDIVRLVDGLVRAGRAAKTIRNVVGTMHSLMDLALRERLIARNPCQFAEVPCDDREPQIRFLTAAELEQLLAAAPGPESTQTQRTWWPVLRLLILTAAMTGMRKGELRAVRWSDLDWGALKLRVRRSYVRGQFGTPKTRRSVRAIPLASRLVEELEQHHRSTVWNADDDLVLAHPHTGRPLDHARLLEHFKAALIRANVRPVRLHDLRHTFATQVAASGQVSLRTLQEWMGHCDAKTTQIYADYMPGEREAELIDLAFANSDGPFMDQCAQNTPSAALCQPREPGIPTQSHGV